MLKIGSVKWRGKCSRHPTFDPLTDGRGGVKGGCPKCDTLVDIHECHQRMLRLMRGFAPQQSPKKTGPTEDLQESLFAGL
jgi:hypothetical protein